MTKLAPEKRTMDISVSLIVDDNEADQFLTKLVIEEFNPNIEVISAYDGQEALDLLSTMDNQPGIIFLDINMPGMNGLEFLEEYSRWEHQAPVIAMLTTSEQTKDRQNSMSYGFVRNYFTKPLGKEDLEIICANYLNP